jgi:hypothetical protein
LASSTKPCPLIPSQICEPVHPSHHRTITKLPVPIHLSREDQPSITNLKISIQVQAITIDLYPNRPHLSQSYTNPSLPSNPFTIPCTTHFTTINPSKHGQN